MAGFTTVWKTVGTYVPAHGGQVPHALQQEYKVFEGRAEAVPMNNHRTVSVTELIE